ncbi:hypothetical protein V2J09_021242 [Rumex salicifolius]
MEEPKIQRIGSSKRRIPQQISVPFLWEEKPGMPRTQWPLPPQPDLLMLLPPPPPPVVPCRPPPPPPPGNPAKFIVSIPFKWEEKPGTPIRSFARDPSLAPKNKNLPLPPAYYSQFFECFDSDHESSFDEDMDPDWLTELDRDASSSGPSLLANRLVPATAISSAVPYEASSSYSSSFPDDDDDDSSSDSYETGNTSPVGNSFLEQLFPLYAAKPNSPPPPVKTQPRSKGVAWSGERSVVFRRPQTLGDLIMLSRRRSYMQKAAGITKSSVSKEFEDPNGIGCFAFGSGKGGIARLLGGKTLLSLKFV